MRKRKLITLETGLNEIDISYKDLGTSSVKLPIAILPAGAEIHNATINVIEKCKSSNISGQTNPDSCIKSCMMLGIEGDNQTYLSYTKEIANIFGRTDANTGTYFSDPEIYNSDSKVILENWISLYVWNLSGNLNTARSHLSGCGSQNAGLSFGGYYSSVLSTTEEYDGSSWSSGGALNTARYSLMGTGTQTAGLCAGGTTGTYSTVTEEYNGSSWSTGGALATATVAMGGAGTQDAALGYGGHDISNSLATTTEYNGSSWSLSNDMNVARTYIAGCGTQTAAMSCTGEFTNTTEEYNGSTWALASDSNKSIRAGGAFGVQTDAVCTGGEISDGTRQSSSEEYDGVSWIMSNDRNIVCTRMASGGLKTAGFQAGGTDQDAVNTRGIITEEYNQADLSTISMTGKLILSLTIV